MNKFTKVNKKNELKKYKWELFE